MKASAIKDKMENRLRLFNRKVEPSSMYSAIADAADFVMRKFTVSTTTINITTTSGTGTYELTVPASFAPWKIKRIVYPSTWDDRIEPREKSLFDEVKRQLDNNEITVLLDQPTFYTVYSSGLKRYIQFMDESTIDAGLTITIDMSMLFNDSIINDDFEVPIPIELKNLWFYKSMAEYLPPLDTKLAAYYESMTEKEVVNYNIDSSQMQQYQPASRDLFIFPTG